MIVELPERIVQRRKNRIYYQAAGVLEGQVIAIKIITPGKKENTITLQEFGYGLYYFDYDFIDIGDYVGVLFENGKHVGSSIFRVAF